MRNSKQKQADLVLMSGKKKNKSLLVSLSGKSTKNALKFLSFHKKNSGISQRRALAVANPVVSLVPLKRIKKYFVCTGMFF